MQLASNPMALLGHFELPHLLLKLQALLSEMPDQVAGDAQVDRPHDVDIGTSTQAGLSEDTTARAASRAARAVAQN